MSSSLTNCADNIRGEDLSPCFNYCVCKRCEMTICFVHNKRSIHPHPQTSLDYTFYCKCIKPMKPIGGKDPAACYYDSLEQIRLYTFRATLGLDFHMKEPARVESWHDFFVKKVLPLVYRGVRRWLKHHRWRKQRVLSKIVFKEQSGAHVNAISDLIEEFNSGPASSGKQESA